MKIYAAPMEGVTGYVYRNAHRKYFRGIDKYFTPFLTPKQGKGWTSSEKNDVAPEHNRTLVLVPQILTNRAEDFVRMAEKLLPSASSVFIMCSSRLSSRLVGSSCILISSSQILVL